MTPKTPEQLHRMARFHVQQIGQAAHDVGIDASEQVKAALAAVDEMDIAGARRILAAVQRKLEAAQRVSNK